jgi:hypothetical protein
MEFDFNNFSAEAVAKIKGFYFYFEDKWYSFLDRIDKQVAIYKVVDPVDQVIPSYILFLLVILFFLILTGYLLSFNNTYDIRIVTLDSETNNAVGGVNIFGSVNEADFDEYTDSLGLLEFPVTGPPMNFFEVFFRIFIPQDDDFEFIVSTRKEGYASLDDEEFVLTTDQLEGELYLSPVGGEADNDFPGAISITLRDSETRDKIMHSSSYIKFKCDNDASFTTKTVKDSDDGSIDGVLVLNAENCSFRITEVGSDGYETKENSFTAPQSREVTLTPINNVSKGSAKINVVELGTSPAKKISNVSVKILKDLNGSMSTVAQGTTDNSGVVNLTNISPGSYIITAISLDQNSEYLPVTPSDDITIQIVASNLPTEKIVFMEKINPNDVRRIFVKLVDADSSNPLSGAELSVYWLRKDQNKLVADTEAGANPVIADSNGLVTLTGFSVRNEGQLVAIAHADGYLYTPFTPSLYKVGEGPQVIELSKADATNSGKAQVNVKEANTAGSNRPRPLRGAETTIYLKLPQLNIERVVVDKGLTNVEGQSFFSELPIGTYSASATYSEAGSGISPTKALDANQLIIFDLNINTNISFLKVMLFDAITKQRIENADSKAKVKIYTLSNSSSPVRTYSETISQIGLYFTSSTYFPEERLEVIAVVPGYAQKSIQNRTDLSAGSNDFNIYLYPTSALSGNVNIFFFDVYDDVGLIERGSKQGPFTWNKDEEYFLQFDVVAHKTDLNYTELLSFVRSNEFADVLGVPINTPKIFHDSSDILNITTEQLETDEIAQVPPHPDTYYFPSNIAAYKEENAEGRQAVIKWKNSDTNGKIEATTYTFVVKFKLNEFADDDVVEFKYRAKEKHLGGETETDLEEISFVLGEARCDGICFRVNLNSKSVSLSSVSSTKYIGNKVQPLNFETGNPFTVEIYNGLDNPVSGSLKAYSYDGITDEFISVATGDLHFGVVDGGTSITLAQNLSTGSRTYSETKENSIFPANRKSTNYIVLEYNVSGGSTYRAFIDTYVPGKTLKLRDAEFLAGVKDQNFSDYVVPSAGSGTPILFDTVKIFVDVNCDGQYEQSSPLSAAINPAIGTNYFERKIPGIFKINNDCIIVHAEAQNYEKLVEKVYASTGGTLDPTLACINISDSDGLRDIDLEWGKTTNIRVTNDCDESVRLFLETSLVCTTCGQSNMITLTKGSSKEFTIKGENISYDSTVQFSDVLGLFPVFVKAKRASASVHKEFAIADKLSVHLTNPNECFIISKDAFDFVSNPDAPIDFYFENECQYTEFEDYYVPKALLNSFGAQIINSNETDIDSVEFEWQLVANAADYIVTESTETREGYIWADRKNAGKDCTNKYKYLAVTATKAEMNEVCAQYFGEGWEAANISSAQEFSDMAGYLQQAGAPKNNPVVGGDGTAPMGYTLSNECEQLISIPGIGPYLADDASNCSADVMGVVWQNNRWEIEDYDQRMYIFCEKPTGICSGADGVSTENPLIDEYLVQFDMSEVDGRTSKVFFKWLDYVPQEDINTGVYGASIKEMRVIYNDGTPQLTIQGNNLPANFKVSPTPVTCVCDGTARYDTLGQGRGCTSTTGSTCVLGYDESEVFDDYGDTNYYRGFVYIPITKRQIETIEFDLLGNADPTNLSFLIRPYVEYDITTVDVSISNTTSEKYFGMGGFTIYPFEGVTYILRNVSYGKTALGTTLPEKYCVAKEQGLAWLDNSENPTKIYWVEPYYTTRTESQNICQGTGGYMNRLGVSTAILPDYSSEIPSSVKTGIQNFISTVATPEPQGVWGSGTSILTKTEAGVQNNSTLINAYYPSCVYSIPQNVLVKDRYCDEDIINVVCTDTENNIPECYVADNLESNIFFDLGYLGSRNPKVWVQIKSGTVKSNPTAVTQNGAVIIWVEGKYLKARFIGEDILAFNDGRIELQLDNDFLAGTQYGIINIKDYVNQGRAKN